jgi:hypothetical protein
MDLKQPMIPHTTSSQNTRSCLRGCTRIQIVEVATWLEDYSNHVLTPRFDLTPDQVIEVANAIEEKIAISKKKEKMFNDY